MPLEERGSFIARAVMGSTIGMVVNFPLCALLIESLGWESAFYIIGASTLIWGRTNYHENILDCKFWIKQNYSNSNIYALYGRPMDNVRLGCLLVLSCL